MSAYIGTRAAANWTGQIGSGGVADDTVTTVPLQSATGLTNGKVYIATLNRVDSNGTATPSAKEVVKGTLSGSNLINCTRGVEGTAQSHNAGAVVEILFTATHHNELVEGLEVEHGSDGTHDFSSSNVDFQGISLGAGTTMTSIKDEDNMASDSATALATQQSIKAYVDSSVPVTDAGAYIKPATDGDDMRVYDAGGTDYLESQHDGTDATIQTNAGDLELLPASTKVVKQYFQRVGGSATDWGNGAAPSNRNDQLGFIQVGAVGSDGSGNISATFNKAFSNPPIVVIQQYSGAATATATRVTATTTTGFTGNGVAGQWFMFIAIGPTT